MDLLADDETEAQLPDGWDRAGEEIVGTCEFDASPDGVGFAAATGGLAREAFPYPELRIGWREVEVRLTTQDAGGITGTDLDRPGRLDDVYA